MITTNPAGAGAPRSAIGVLGTGSYLPASVITNDEVAGPAGVDDAWVRSRTGIHRRRRAKPDEATSDLAVMAGRMALVNAGVSAADVSLVVVATSTPDSPQPPTASVVADLLDTRPGTPAFDINVVCSGFLFALATAEALLRTTGGRYALVLGADVYSRILDPADRRTAVLFGDGAGAVLLGPVAGPGLVTTRLAGFGAERDLIRVPAGGSRMPAGADTLAAGLHYFTMNGRAVREFVVDRVVPALRDFLADCGHRPEDVAHFLPHQANGRLVDTVAEALGIPPARTHKTVTEYGNTGAASVPVTLDAVAQANRLHEGDLILLAAFGGGMAMGATLLRWSPLPARPIDPRRTHPGT